ncbi:MAG: hypothetical protein NC098_00495 [Lachnoclostridium sp.]|nr:hypothetical protein [Lachnoclostridium sp.]
MKKLLFLILSALTVATAWPDKTTRANLRPKQAPELRVEALTSPYDTLPALGDEVRISGYDKPLNSRKEAFLVTNLCADTIEGLLLELDYLDLKGRQLHQEKYSADCSIPPGETRQIIKPSWDVQNSFYYHLGKQPRIAGVTPFKVRISPTGIVITHR